MEVLLGAVESQTQSRPVPALPVAARRVAPNPRSIRLVARPVDATLAEAASARKQPQRAPLALAQQHAVLAVCVRCNIDRPALPQRLLYIPLGPQPAAGSQQPPRPALALNQQAVVVCAFRPVARAQFNQIGRASCRER